MSVRNRVIRTFAAQIYGQISGIVVQLMLVPVLIHAWGTTLYGTWLLLSAVPFYLTFSDFGFTFIAKNEMVMAVASGNRPAGVRTFQSVLVMLSLALPFAYALMVGPAMVLDVSRILSLHGYPNGQARLVFALLVANVAIYQYCLLVFAGIRSENRPATEATFAATGRLTEGILLTAAALMGGGLPGAALALLTNRICVLVLAYLWMRRVSPWLRLGWAQASMAEIKRLFHPALAYMFMPLAQAVIIQGPVLIVGNVLDPASVVIFSTSRTLARLGTAATNVLTNSFVTEYAARAGVDDLPGFSKLFRNHLIFCGAAVIAYTVGIFSLDDRLMQIFTHGKVPIIEPFFGIVVAGVVSEMIWTTLFTPISAVNRHRNTTYTFFGLCFGGIFLCYPLTAWFGLTGVAIFTLFVHLVMIPVASLFSRPSRLLAGHAERMRSAFSAG